jgi:hypothetical protein
VVQRSTHRRDADADADHHLPGRPACLSIEGRALMMNT